MVNVYANFLLPLIFSLVVKLRYTPRDTTHQTALLGPTSPPS